MNEELKELQRRIELATTAGDLPEDALDMKTRSLREGWLALGRLLEEDDAFATEPMPEFWKMPPAAPQRRFSRRALVTALAVSLLACSVAAWAWRERQPAKSPSPTPEQTAEIVPRAVEPRPTPVPVIAPPTQLREAVAEKKPSLPANANEPQWDDSLDDQITQVGQEVVRYQQDWLVQAAGLTAIQQGLEKAQEDTNGNSL